MFDYYRQPFRMPNSYYDPPEYSGRTGFYKERNVKRTRKPHTCDYCKRVIPIGSAAIYYTMVTDDDGFQYGYHHVQNYNYECTQ